MLRLFQKILTVFIIFLISAVVEVKPSFEENSTNSNLNGLTLNITEFSPPEKTRLSPFLFYDEQHNVIWTGDITANSGKILEFELNLGKFVMHNLPDVDYVTHIVMDSKGRLWYIDLGTSSLGRFNPDDGSNRIYPIPNNATSSGITLNKSDNVWIVIPDQSEILEFDTKKEKFNTVNLPPTSSFPLAITSDRSGKVWIAENLGKLASIDPNSFNVTEFGQARLIFSVPTSIVSEPVTGKIYFSEHNAYMVSQFDPLTKTFKRYSVNFGGFPAGLTFDNYGNLWVSQHTLDKVAVINTVTGQIKQLNLPQGALVQWLEKDSNGDIIFVDQRSNLLDFIKTTTPTVPEFPFSAFILVVGVLAVLFMSSLSQYTITKSLRNDS